jgi:hypothetical protein
MGQDLLIVESACTISVTMAGPFDFLEKRDRDLVRNVKKGTHHIGE